MSRVAFIVLADTETHEGMGCAVNALEAVKEFKEGHDMAHRLSVAVKDCISGLCEFCAGAFGVKDQVVACGATLTGEHDGHPSFKKLVTQGYQIFTF